MTTVAIVYMLAGAAFGLYGHWALRRTSRNVDEIQRLNREWDAKVAATLAELGRENPGYVAFLGALKDQP